ncbi:uncharacterized protein LOC131034612 isoform X2 [Cryptomeria japonica]|uniref:uncharacterized protein LOC131034612 isoform X2 n=1 Tax=Cryptomeria japonica TaxID=3369 RepID=UPI0027DA79F3|nr:uncharacterized protein LOC131034612 isoform X2 [Cryptomeria japonica]
MAFIRSNISSVIPTSAILLISNASPRSAATYKTLKFSILYKTPKLRAAGKESYESKETEVRISQESNTLSKQSVLQNEDDFLRKVSVAKDAEEVLHIFEEKFEGIGGGVISGEDCAAIISAALARNNVDLAFSILQAMRCNLIQKTLERKLGEGNLRDSSTQRWRWAQPDVTTYTTLVRGLAASLRVSDAIQTIKDISRIGAPPGNEVPFGKVVKCPNCMIALAVVQPQHGIQLVSCSKCRYQYELMSGDIVSLESESISTNISVMEKGMRFLQIMKRTLPAAVHSIMIRAPNGLARTHRFATDSADLPVQEGERATVALAAPSNVGRNMGPLRLSARTPGWRPGEPMSITNHVTGLEFRLLPAPPKSGSSASFEASFIIPALALLAGGDAATAFIDPTLPKLISTVAVSATVVGAAVNALVLPQLNKLPQRMVDIVALRQQLLSQYDLMQSRLKELIQDAEEEVWMLARMCHLENKIEVVGESSYSARRSRVKHAQESLDEALVAKLELIDSYAKVSCFESYIFFYTIASLIEIEVEMDVDVFAAETATNTASIAEQIERLMELEDLEKQWQIQAEANDEIERLLRSEPVLPDF